MMLMYWKIYVYVKMKFKSIFGVDIFLVIGYILVYLFGKCFKLLLNFWILINVFKVILLFKLFFSC